MTAVATAGVDRASRAAPPFDRASRSPAAGPPARADPRPRRGDGHDAPGPRFTEADFRGERFRDHPRDLRGNSDLLSLTQPAAVAAIHAAYLDAGADIVTTNSFTATRIAQADYGFDPTTVRELNVAAARLARDAADAAERGRARTARASSPAPSARRTGPPR